MNAGEDTPEQMRRGAEMLIFGAVFSTLGAKLVTEVVEKAELPDDLVLHRKTIMDVVITELMQRGADAGGTVTSVLSVMEMPAMRLIKEYLTKLQEEREALPDLGLDISKPMPEFIGNLNNWGHISIVKCQTIEALDYSLRRIMRELIDQVIPCGFLVNNDTLRMAGPYAESYPLAELLRGDFLAYNSVMQLLKTRKRRGVIIIPDMKSFFGEKFAVLKGDMLDKLTMLLRDAQASVVVLGDAKAYKGPEASPARGLTLHTAQVAERVINTQAPDATPGVRFLVDDVETEIC